MGSRMGRFGIQTLTVARMGSLLQMNELNGRYRCCWLYNLSAGTVIRGKEQKIETSRNPNSAGSMLNNRQHMHATLLRIEESLIVNKSN